MLFNSLTFAVFLPIVYLLYRGLPFRGRDSMLLAASGDANDDRLAAALDRLIGVSLADGSKGR